MNRTSIMSIRNDREKRETWNREEEKNSAFFQWSFFIIISSIIIIIIHTIPQRIRYKRIHVIMGL